MPQSHAEPLRVPRAWKRRGPRPTPPGSAPHGRAASRRAGQTLGRHRSRPQPFQTDASQSATRLETRSVSVAAGQRVRNRLLSKERRKATVLAEQRPPASLVDFQRCPSSTRFAWCWRGCCHCPPMDHYTDPQASLRCRPSPSLMDAFGLLVPGEVFASFTTSVCFCSSFRSKQVPGSPGLVWSFILNCLSSLL